MVVKRSAFLKDLIDPETVKRRLRFCAMYDAIAAPNFRAFEFHPQWRRGEQMGAFKNGEGDFFFAWFSSKGTVIRGFHHERGGVDPPAVFEGLPPSLSYVLKEPAFAQDELSFALWHTGRGGWRSSDALRPLQNGAVELLGCLDRNFEKWRKRYYGSTRASAIEVLWWEREPITREVIEALNPDDADVDVVREEAKLLKWPIDLSSQPKAKAKAKAKAEAKAKPKTQKKVNESFGEAEFIVRCEPARVRMLIHGDEVVAEAKVDVYEELFELVKARLDTAKRKGA